MLELRDVVTSWRREGFRVGFVPTMGALHEGHLSLVNIAGKHCDRVVVSIFVNPAQFAPGEDFESYPRAEAEDIAKLSGYPTHLVYLPARDEIYPKDFSTEIRVGGPADELESEARPHFFHGVSLIVTKLLLQVLPDVAVFGEKDYQQLQVIQKLVADLDIPVKIIGGPTVRESDGLAMSSRNAYLSVSERIVAGKLNILMQEAIEEMTSGASVSATIDKARNALLAAGFDEVDYLEVRDAKSLKTIHAIDHSARLLAAVRIGTTRLIDNMGIE